jgi:hypothetical protein
VEGLRHTLTTNNTNEDVVCGRRVSEAFVYVFGVCCFVFL